MSPEEEHEEHQQLVRKKYEDMTKEQLVDLISEIHTDLEYADDWEVALTICETLGIDPKC